MKGVGVMGAVVACAACWLLVRGFSVKQEWLEMMETGDASLDQWRATIVQAASVRFGGELLEDGRILRALMAILKNESGGRWFLGDMTDLRGPSVGPMQVHRATAVGMGLWSNPSDDEALNRASYANLGDAAHARSTIHWGVRVFEQKLADAGGDIREAIRRYNGSGSAAERYRQNALAFVETTWGKGVV